MQTVLVTGGAGYIGSHVSKVLYQRGFFPACFDNLSTGHRASVKWGPLVVGDLRDKSAILKVCEKYNPFAVMHFAASCYVEESMKTPLKYYENNVMSTLNLLQVMEEFSIDKMIFSSSCATYGIPSKVPIKESALQQPINIYGRTKLICEQMITDWAKVFGFSAVILRYFNVAGADVEGEIGESHFPETHLIPLALRAILSEKPVIIYGNDYATPDGTAIRDYVHVLDLAEAHVRALQFLMKSGGIHAFNLGAGKGYSVQDIVSAAQRIIGKTADIAVRPRRAGDPPVLTADPSYAEAVLGWKPQFSELSLLLQTALNWQQTLDLDARLQRSEKFELLSSSSNLQ